MLHQRIPLTCVFCNPEDWVWRYSKSHHVEERHAASLAVSKTNPKTVRFKDSFGNIEAEQAAVAKNLRKGKNKAVRAPVARLSEVSKKKRGSDESDESRTKTSHTQTIAEGCLS